MNKRSIFVNLAIVIAFSIAPLSCKHDDPRPAPVIESFSPVSGIPGAMVTITGNNFNTVADKNIVLFNGIPATVSTASKIELAVVVPSGATTGKISVAANNHITLSVDDFTVFESPTVSSFTPASGPAGTSVTITGTNFSATTTDNSVTFNGAIATITSATATQLIVTVPSNATTGKINVSVHGLSTSSSTDFTFFPTPTISSFTPEFYQTGTTLPTVTITGTNFSSVTANNTVKFNGTAATVSTASATQLTVALPSTATSGKITVTVNGVTGTSANDFLIGCPDAVVQNIVTSSYSESAGHFFYHVAFEIKNVGTIPLDINKIGYQSGVGSTTSKSAGSYQDTGGGFYFSGQPLLPPNGVASVNYTSANGFIQPNENYAIIELLLAAGTPVPDCNTANNIQSGVLNH